MSKNAKDSFIERNVLLLYVTYPLARIVSAFLAKTSLQPTHITFSWYAVMIMGFALGLARYPSIVIILLFLIAYFLDCLDGQFARDMQMTSEVGKILDDFGGDMFYVTFWISFAYSINESAPTTISNESIGVAIALTSALRGCLAFRIGPISAAIEQASPSSGRGNKLSWKDFVVRNKLFNFGSLLFPMLLLSNMTELNRELMVIVLALQISLLGVSIRQVFLREPRNV